MRAWRFWFAMIAALAVASSAQAQSASRTRLRSWPNPSAYNQPIVLQADVDGLGGGAPKGMVTFFDGDVPLGSGALSPYTAGQGTIAAGWTHSCALTSAGGAKCWGANYTGQLGDGTRSDRHRPVSVWGLSSGVVAIATGPEHSCALTSAGAVKCWGDNVDGQLGDGTTTTRYAPVYVSGLLRGVVAIALDNSHTCALTSAGAVECWGHNGNGQLGDGTTKQRHSPVAVTGLSSGVVAIAAGTYHNCALTDRGAVKCWGHNAYGQLGDGTTKDRHAPVAVSGLSSGVVAIAGGRLHTCARTSAGAVKCWGYNWAGELGDGTTTTRLTPVAVSGLSSGVHALAVGALHTCALTGAGAVKCWGGNGKGQLGDGTTTDRHTPVDVSSLASGVVAIAAGWEHSCALTLSGVADCWGKNESAQLGDRTTTDHHTPVTVSGLTSLVRARAWLSIRTLRGGAHNLRARFPGDAFHAPSEGTLVQRVR